MSKLEMLSALVKQQLDAATEEILRLVDRTLTDYEEELSRLKANEEQHKLPDAVFNPKDQLHRSVFPADAPPVVSPGLDQGDPQPPHVKDKREELWTNLAGDQLRGLEEADITKSENDEEKPQSSQLHHSQTKESTEAEPAARSSAQQMETEAASSSDSHRPSSSIIGQKPWRCSVCKIRFHCKKRKTMWL